MKALIVDDEMHIRNGLQKSVKWRELGIEQIFTAEDGREALAVCLKEKPEILITDIRMPGMDGLTLAQAAIDKAKVKKVVILSGFSEFEYAKTAIRLGVVDYLLKPVKLEELSVLLKRMVEEIRLESRQKELQNQEMVWEVIRGTKSPGILRTLFGENQGEVLLAVLERDVPYGRCFSVLEIKTEYMQILTKMENEVVLLFQIKGKDDRTEYHNVFYQELHAINRRQNTGCSCSIGVSERGQLKDICRLYRQAQEALKRRFYKGNENCIFHEEVEENEKKFYPLLNLDKKAISESVSLFQIDLLHDQIHRQFEFLRKERCMEERVVQELCLGIQNILFESMMERGVDIAGILNQNQELFSGQMSFSSITDYEAWISDYCYLLLKGFEDLSGKRYSAVISKAVDYINQHYSEELSLVRLAENVNKSTSYFSCIFKKEMGVNFNEYLNQVRIRKAKELLRVPDAVIYEVSEKTGFSDYKYFTKVFKKQCGCSPSEYVKTGECKIS